MTTETALDRIKEAARQGRIEAKRKAGGRGARKRAEELEKTDPYMTSTRFTNKQGRRNGAN